MTDWVAETRSLRQWVGSRDDHKVPWCAPKCGSEAHSLVTAWLWPSELTFTIIILDLRLLYSSFLLKLARKLQYGADGSQECSALEAILYIPPNGFV